MTSSANDDWNHYRLKQAIGYMWEEARKWRRLAQCCRAYPDSPAVFSDKYAIEQAEMFEYAVEFIEYNMEQMEITGGNGD